MRAAGIDLAGKEENPTGICILTKEPQFFTLYSNDEIVECVTKAHPTIVAIDAPLIEGEIRIRRADKKLKKYGAMPPTLSSMRELCVRGKTLAQRISFPTIEVFPTASAKILGFYRKDYKESASLLHVKVRNEHEMDAYIAALTGLLYLKGKTVEIGETEKVIIPLR